jgi:hypothetical protein
MRVHNLGAPLLEDLGERCHKSRIWQRRVERLLGIGVTRTEDAAPTCEPVHPHLAVMLDSGTCGPGQGHHVHLMPSSSQFTRKELDHQITPPDERRRVTVGCLKDSHLAPGT